MPKYLATHYETHRTGVAGIQVD